MLIATVINIVLTLGCMCLLLVLYAKFIVPHLAPESAAWGLPVIFVGAIVLSFFIYRAGIKAFSKKVDMDKNFDPLIGGRKQRNRND
jgi:hypothetical protein